MRITNKQLQARLEVINDMLNRPNTYAKGSIVIDGAYGGVALSELVSDGGAERTISGRMTKRELYEYMEGFIKGIQYQRGDYKNNPKKRKGSCASEKAVIEALRKQVGTAKEKIQSLASSAYDGKGPHILFLFGEKKLQYVGKSGKDYTLETVVGKAHNFKTLGAAIHLGQRIQFPDWAKKVGTMKTGNPAKFAKNIQKISYGGKA